MKFPIPLLMIVLAACGTLVTPAFATAPEKTAQESVSTGAPPIRHPELTELHTLLTQAAEANPELRSAFYQWQSALKAAIHADGLPDPRLNFGYYTTPLETRGGPARYKYGLSQNFPLFGKLDLREKKALRQADGRKARLDALKLETFSKVKKAYFEYAYLARAIATTKESIALLEYLEKIATARFTNGLASHADVIRPQVELGKLQERLHSLRASRRPQQARLNGLLNRSETVSIAFPSSLPVMTLAPEDLDWRAEMLRSNPQLRYQAMRTAGKKTDLQLAERDRFPDLTLSLETTEIDNARNSGMQGDGDNPFMVGMSINLPLWGNDKKAAINEQRAAVQAARHAEKGLERQLQTELELALYAYRDAGRKIDLYRDALIPKAKQSLGIVMEEFMSGTGSALDLVDSERTLLELQLTYYRAVTNRAQQIARIEKLVGRELACSFRTSILETSAVSHSIRP